MDRRAAVASALSLLVLALLIPACGGGGGDGGSTPLAPFLITFAKPAHLSGSAPQNPIIYVRFGRSLNPATVTVANVLLTTGVTPVAIQTPAYEDCLKEVRVMPSAGLAASTTYRLSFTAGIQDSNGNPFSPAFIDFTTGNTGDIVRPTFNPATIAEGTVTLTSIELTWTASPDGTAFCDIFLSLTSGCFDFATPYATTAAGAASHVVTGLTRNTKYYFVVRPRDPSGNTDTNETEFSARTLTSFANDVWPIVQGNCSSCHTSGAGSAVMVMSSAGLTLAAWVDVDPVCNTPGNTIPVGAKRVVSGGGTSARDNSFVYNKIMSKAGLATVWCGVPMPQTGGALSLTELATFENWILQGALNN